MKTLMTSIGLALGLLVAPALHAQEGGPEREKKTPEQRATHLTEKMTETLALTADQSARVQDINLRYAQALTDVKAETSDPVVKRQRAKDLKERRDAELKGVLTPEQYARMQEVRAEKHKEMKAKRKAHEGDGAPHPHNE